MILITHGWTYDEDESAKFRASNTHVFSRINPDTGEKEYAVVSRGSATAWDWIQNIFLQPIGLSPDMNMTVSDAKAFVKEKGADNVTFTGHSKGGAEAEMCSLATGADGKVFNPARISGLTQLFNGRPFAMFTSKANIDYFIVKGEILDTFGNQRGILTPYHGNENNMHRESSTLSGFHPIKNHEMKGVRSAFYGKY